MSGVKRTRSLRFEDEGGEPAAKAVRRTRKRAPVGPSVRTKLISDLRKKRREYESALRQTLRDLKSLGAIKSSALCRRK